MRILGITNLYPYPFQLNRATFNRHKFRMLAERHAVRMIVPISWTDELKARWRGVPKLPKDRIVWQDGLLVEHPRYFFPPRLLRGSYGHFYLWSIRQAFWRAVAEFSPNLVHTPWAYPDGWAAIELAREAGLPVVIKVHGSDLLLLDKYPARQAKTIQALQAAHGVIAVSQDIADRLIRYGVPAERVYAILDGADAEVFYPGAKNEARARLSISEGDPLLLFVGNLVPVKAVDVLLAACGMLRQQGTPFRLCLIGEGPLRQTLEKQAAELGIAERMQFLGSLPHQQLPDWYRAADLFVLPSHSEGVPNVLLEASACGTPYVASRVGGIPEIAHLGPSSLVPPGDAPALASAIGKCLSSPGAGNHPHGPARTRREAVAEIEAVFQTIVDNHVRQRSSRIVAGRSVRELEAKR